MPNPQEMQKLCNIERIICYSIRAYARTYDTNHLDCYFICIMSTNDKPNPQETQRLCNTLRTNWSVRIMGNTYRIICNIRTLYSKLYRSDGQKVVLSKVEIHHNPEGSES